MELKLDVSFIRGIRRESFTRNVVVSGSDVALSSILSEHLKFSDREICFNIDTLSSEALPHSKFLTLYVDIPCAQITITNTIGKQSNVSIVFAAVAQKIVINEGYFDYISGTSSSDIHSFHAENSTIQEVSFRTGRIISFHLDGCCVGTADVSGGNSTKITRSHVSNLTSVARETILERSTVNHLSFRNGSASALFAKPFFRLMYSSIISTGQPQNCSLNFSGVSRLCNQFFSEVTLNIQVDSDRKVPHQMALGFIEHSTGVPIPFKERSWVERGYASQAQMRYRGDTRVILMYSNQQAEEWIADNTNPFEVIGYSTIQDIDSSEARAFLFKAARESMGLYEDLRPAELEAILKMVEAWHQNFHILASLEITGDSPTYSPISPDTMADLVSEAEERGVGYIRDTNTYIWPDTHQLRSSLNRMLTDSTLNLHERMSWVQERRDGDILDEIEDIEA